MPIPGRRCRELLAALALERQAAAPRERLWGRLWPDQSDRQARRALNTELWRLRAALRAAGTESESWIVSTPEDLGLRPAAQGGPARDLDTFLAAESATASLEEIEDAVAAYVGAFAEGLDAEWVETSRRWLERVHLRFLHRIRDGWRAAADIARAIDAAEAIVRADPYDETARRALIGMQIESGNRVAALRSLDEVEAIWAGELDLAPEPETMRLRMLCLSPPETGPEDPAFHVETGDRPFEVERIEADAADLLQQRIDRIRGSARLILSELNRIEALIEAGEDPS